MKETPNALGRTLLILGDHRNLNIILEAFREARRFGDWQERLDISDPVLAGRLRSLVADGIFTTIPYNNAPLRHEYRLTERGRELWHVFVALWMWEARWANERNNGRRTLIHDVCDHPCSPLLGCSACGALGVTPRDTSAKVSGDSFERSNPSRRYRRAARAGDPVTDHQTMIATDLLGDRWSMSVMAAAFLGTRRFSDFQQQLVTIPPLTLADRLKLFVDQQLLRRVPIAEGAKRMEYHLTPKGLDFFPALAAIVAWTNLWLTEDQPHPIVIVHNTCGNVFEPCFGCNVCGKRLARREIHFDNQRRGLSPQLRK